jgi:hypothetical protein
MRSLLGLGIPCSTYIFVSFGGLYKDLLGDGGSFVNEIY